MASIKEIAKYGTEHEAALIVKDTSYIPEEKFAFCPMGCAKTVEGILKEVAGTNARIAASLRGEDPASSASYLQFEKRVGEASGLDVLGRLVIESGDLVCRAIDGIPEADLDKPVKMPWGAMFPASAAIFLPASHMSYHDGQVNYIQTLLGDAAFHWAEG